MGKRALSLFLAVMLCVSMLPTAVFADTSGTFETVETITAVAETAERETGTDKTTEETEVPPTKEDGTDIAELAADEAAVSVTKSDGTDGGTFTSLPAALNEAQSGDTVKLLANHVTDWDAVNAGDKSTLAIVTKELTLDLNSKMVDYLMVGDMTFDEETQTVTAVYPGDLTVVSDSEGTGTINGQINDLDFIRGTLDIQSGRIGYEKSVAEGGGIAGQLTCNGNSGTVTISGGRMLGLTVGEGATVTVSGGSLHAGSWYNDGTLNITGGTFSSVKFYNRAGTVAISGGTFGAITNNDASTTIPPMSLLANGYAFYNNDGIVQDGSKSDYMVNVTVKEHTHTIVDGKCACGADCPHTSWENGKCTDCGADCPHKLVSETTSGAYICSDCKAAIVAMVEVNKATTFHADIADALEAAKDNGTVKIIAAENTLKLPDKNGYPVLYADGTLTIDLNGHTLSGGGLMVGGYIGSSSNTRTGNLTVIDSVGGGKIDGEMTGLKVQPGAKVKFDGQATTVCCKLAVYSNESQPAEAKFSGGVIHEINTLSGITCADLLADGYCFYDYSNSTLGEPIKLETLKNQTKVTTPLAVAACSHPEAGEDGKCLYCGLKLTVRDSNGTIYDTLQAAIDAAVSDSSIQWLMLDADMTGNVTFDAAGKTVTVNMNGRKLTSANGIPLTVKNGTLTIEGKAYIAQAGETKDASDRAVFVTGGELIFKGALTVQGGSSTEKASPGIAVTGGKVTFADKVTATGGLQGTHGNAMTCQPAVYATSGELDFQGDLDLNGGLTVTDSAKLTNGLSNGVFQVEYDEAVDARCISVEGSKNYKNLNALLADGYAFVNKANESEFPCTSASMTFWTGNVKIVKHTHTWEQGNGDLYSCTVCSLTCDHTGGFSTGKCEVCGMPCPHAVLDSTDSRCEVCKQTMVARIMTKNNEGYDLLKHYASLADAINHAADGSTITVVAKDNQLSLPDGIYVKTESKGLTLDLNGHSLGGYSLNVGGSSSTGKLTVTDRSGNGAVGLVVRSGGTVVFEPENVNTALLQLQVYGGDVTLRGGHINAGQWTLKKNVVTLADLIPSDEGYAYRFYRGVNYFGDWVPLADAQNDAVATTFGLAVMKCEHTGIDADNNCLYCGKAMTAKCAGTYYTSVKDAIAAANANDTVTLLKSVAESCTIEKNMTLDLGGNNIDNNITIKSGSTLTLAGEGIVSVVQSGTSGDGVVGGALNVASDKVTVNLLSVQQKPTPEMNLSKGTFWKIELSDNLKDQMKANELLAKGYAFASNGSGNVVDGYVYRLDNVKVVSHTHEITTGNKCVCGYPCDHSKGFTDNGKCPDCGKACEHKNLDENYYCRDCKQQMGVMIESPDAKITYIPFGGNSLAEAVNTAENDSKLTLLADVDFNAVLDQKTLTLDFNNKSVTGGWFEIGKLTWDSNYNVTDVTAGAKLILTGHSAKEDYNSSNVTERGLINVYNNNTLVMDGWSGTLGGINASRYFNADKPTIQIDNGTFCSVSLQNGTGYTLGDFLKTGYAFKYTDGSGYLSYNHELVYPDFEFFNISVVKCTEHNDSDGDGMCDYCNGQIVAQVTVRNGGSRVYTDFQDAVDSMAASGVHTVTLLADAVGSYTITKGHGTTIKLNGKTVNEITVSGESNMAFNDKGTVNSVIFSGKTARFNAGNQLFTISAITVKDGATWSSILPNADAEMYGYQVYNSDQSGYKWYDAGMLEEFLGDGNTVNNVKVQPLPVTKDPILMIDGQKIATQSSISVYKPFVFSFESWVDNGWDGSGVLFIQKEGDTALTPVSAEGESDIYTCPERTFDISQSGTYTVWAEVSKQGYTRRSKTYTLNVGAFLQDATINLKQSEFTYTPLSNGDAEEFQPEIDSVKLFGHVVPADAYTINGETSGKDARTYTMTITAKEDSDYIGSVSVNWTIHPRVLTEVGVCTYIKKYDGTREITVDNIGKNDSPPHFFYDNCPAGGIVLKYNEDYKIRNLNANFSKPDAGEYADVSFTVELGNSNYTFKDNDSNDTTYTTVDTGMYIEQADLPTGYEPGEGGVTVRNGAAHTYTYDVSALLKQLPTGLSYGTKSYTVTNTYIMDGGYLDEGSVSIDENGILSIPVKKVLTLADAEVARITVTVHAQNYADFTVTVMVYARNQIVPTGNPKLSDNGTITYGDKISKIQLSGKLNDDVNKTEVEGTFEWEKPNEGPSGAGDYEAAWLFTPTGDNAYLYAPVTGKATIKVNKAPLVEGVDYEVPTAVSNLVYKVTDNTPQTLHTSGRVIGTVGTMKYTTDNPESAAAVWSDTPLTSRDAGEFVVYYKVFGDENHLDSAYGTLRCRIAKYKLVYKIVCLPKVYDGTTNGDPKNIESITFLDEDSKTVKVDLAEQDYTIDSITYDSKNVGQNLGTIPVSATAVVTLRDTKAANNYELAEEGNEAYGCITPARIENVDFHGYTYKVRYIDTHAKTVTASSFGDVDRRDYEIHSDMVSAGDSRIIRTISRDTSGITFAIADNLSADDANKTYTIKVRIYTKDHNYCTDELPFTIMIADKDRPLLSADPIEVTYNNKAVPADSIKGTATVSGHEISGSWKFKGKAPTTVAESGDYTVVFEPAYPDYYYGGEETVHVTVKPRDIGDNAIAFPSGDSFVYTGKSTIPYIYGEYKYDESKEAFELLKERDYTLTYPADTTNVGEKKITVTGLGNFGGTKELIYTITPCTLKPTIVLSETDYIYDGNEKKPTVTVTVEDKTLVEGRDFEVAYENNTYAEDGAKVTVTAKGNYGFDKQEVPFHIGKANAVIETAPGASPFIYDGSSHALVTAGSAAGGSFEYKLGDGNWTTAVPTAENAAEYTVWYRVIGDSNHNNTAESSVTVTVGRRDIADAKITLGSSLTYNRKEQTQTVSSVVCGDRLNATFTVTDNRKTNAGTYTLTVAGTGNFTGVCSHDFTIAKKTVTASVTVDGTHIYNGKAIEPSVITVKDGEDVIPDTEYTTAFKDNTDAGTATVLITNADGGNYIVNGTGTFEIHQAHITVRPKSISKVYGDKPVFALESDSELITEEQLADFTRSTRFTSDGTKEDADVLPGGYEITAVLTENETKNLLLSVSGTGILTVVPKKLTVTVNDVSRVYGDPNPELSVSYDGFIEGEDETVLGGALVLAYHESINETAEVRTHYGVTTASGLTSDNYAITYVPGNVTITKILVSVRAGSARRNYLSAVFDKPLENLTAANFAVTDENGNPVAITSVAALDGNETYSLKGSFEVGKKYTVKVVLHGAAADATHQMTTNTFVITPIRTSGSGGSGSGSSGGSTVTTCTVTFETNGASKLADQTVAKGSVLQEPTSPTKDGFTFAGWYADKELQTKYDFSAKVQANLTLYAAWTETKKDNTENQIILTIGEKEALVFGKIKTNDVAPKIVNDRTMLPARFVAENLGADVSWNEEQELVTIKGKNSKTNKDVTILIYIGSDIAYVDGKRFKLDSPAFVENDRTYTPIRFISEELGASVEWIEEEQKVVITK